MDYIQTPTDEMKELKERIGKLEETVEALKNGLKTAQKHIAALLPEDLKHEQSIKFNPDVNLDEIAPVIK